MTRRAPDGTRPEGVGYARRQFGSSGQMADDGAAPLVYRMADYLNTVENFLYEITAANSID